MAHCVAVAGDAAATREGHPPPYTPQGRPSAYLLPAAAALAAALLRFVSALCAARLLAALVVAVCSQPSHRLPDQSFLELLQAGLQRGTHASSGVLLARWLALCGCLDARRPGLPRVAGGGGRDERDWLKAAWGRRGG